MDDMEMIKITVDRLSVADLETLRPLAVRMGYVPGNPSVARYAINELARRVRAEAGEAKLK